MNAFRVFMKSMSLTYGLLINTYLWQRDSFQSYRLQGKLDKHPGWQWDRDYIHKGLV